MLQPKISLIIPIYNVEKFLQQTLESVQKQTLTDFEAICVNDGSLDTSLDIIQKFSLNDKRFKLIDKPNGGVSSARNVGLAIATGKYIMFLDGDDYLHPQAMEVALEAITRSKADVCQFGYQEVQFGENVEIKPITKDCLITTDKESLKNYILHRTVAQIFIWNKIYKADIAKSAEFYNLHPGEDDVYSLQILLKAEKFALIEPALIYYVQNPQSVMHTISEQKMIENRIGVEKYFSQILNEFVQQNQSSNIHQFVQRFLQKQKYNMLKYLLIKPLRAGVDNAVLAQNYIEYKKITEKDGCNLFTPKFKHKLLLRLIAKRHYTLARVLMWF